MFEVMGRREREKQDEIGALPWLQQWPWLQFLTSAMKGVTTQVLIQNNYSKNIIWISWSYKNIQDHFNE